MKTSLYFEGPDDLSVGTIRIDGGDDAPIADWIATPDNRTFRIDDIAPGMYSSEIGPAGVAPQSVVFEVRAGVENRVILPSFSILASAGSNTSFFDSASRQAHADLLARAGLPAAPRGEASAAHLEDARPLQLSQKTSRIAIGLSEETAGRETFDTFSGKSRLEVYPGRIELDIPEDERRDPWAAHRVRMSAAIEGVRIERCLLPLYRGGTRIVVSTPPLASADLELSVLPVDPAVRALLRALDAGTSAEVGTVQRDVIGPRLDNDDNGPWFDMLVGLLSIRFPKVFAPLDPHWAAALAGRAGWAFDTHVIRASAMLTASRELGAVEQARAVTEVIRMLARAQVGGAPYYRYTNELFAEMAAGIASYLKEHARSIDPAVVHRFQALHSRWHRELPLQRGAGPTFTWLARDQAELKQSKTLLPYRRPSGRLSSRSTLIVFEGELRAGKITLLGGTARGLRGTVQAGTSVEKSRHHAGEKAVAKGFRLTATFLPTAQRDWTTIVLAVDMLEEAGDAAGSVAWFYLHPTFAPSAVKVMFQNRRAELRIQAWGGFVVRAWIPGADVTLACDLARLDGAPHGIRTR